MRASSGLGFVFPALLLLAACGGGDEKAAAESGDDIVSASDLTSGMAGAATGLVSTDGLPDFVTMYRGGTPAMHMKSVDGDKRGGMFSYTVDAPLKDVVDFHRAAFEKAGIAITMEAAAGEGITFGGSSEDETRNAMAIIGAGEDGTSASITYGVPKG